MISIFNSPTLLVKSQKW